MEIRSAVLTTVHPIYIQMATCWKPKPALSPGSHSAQPFLVFSLRLSISIALYPHCCQRPMHYSNEIFQHQFDDSYHQHQHWHIYTSNNHSRTKRIALLFTLKLTLATIYSNASMKWSTLLPFPFILNSREQTKSTLVERGRKTQKKECVAHEGKITNYRTKRTLLMQHHQPAPAQVTTTTIQKARAHIKHERKYAWARYHVYCAQKLAHQSEINRF